MEKKEGERVFSVDLLRVVAIFLIVLFHVWYELNPDNKLRLIGLVGVSLFFIISGFTLAKKYPLLEKISLKWFAKRWIKIASVYYLSLIAIVFLFAKQTYSGSTLKVLSLHAIFIDPFIPSAAYSIISPAWFLTPLVALYLLFPYLNKLIKNGGPAIFLLLFELSIISKMHLGGLVNPNPLFFLGEFCFGIAFAHNWKKSATVLALTSWIISPYFALPFAIFYLSSFLDKLPIKASILSWLGKQVIVVFLLHEAFMKVFLNKWHVSTFPREISLIILTIATLLIILISGLIQSLFNPLLNTSTNRTKS